MAAPRKFNRPSSAKRILETRIWKYVDDNHLSGKFIDIDTMISALKTTHRDYQRTRKKAFSILVLDVFESMRKIDPRLSQTSLDSTDDELSSDMEYVQYQDTNSLNSSLTHLYKKKKQELNAVDNKVPTAPYSNASSSTAVFNRGVDNRGNTMQHELLQHPTQVSSNNLPYLVQTYTVPSISDPVVSPADRSQGLAKDNDKLNRYLRLIRPPMLSSTPASYMYSDHGVRGLPQCPANVARIVTGNGTAATEIIVDQCGNDSLDKSNNRFTHYPHYEAHQKSPDQTASSQQETVGKRKTGDTMFEAVSRPVSTKKKKRQFIDEASSKIKTKIAEVSHSTLKFKDIGGNDQCLQEVCKLLLHMKHPEIYQCLGIAPPRGFLLHGPPGCGKTLLANAIAGELELGMIKIAATEIVSGVSGESEEKIRELFQEAKNNAPCVLFIDEIDAITPKRETAQKEMERRIVAQLLTCMDELHDGVSNGHVLVVGATNRPDSIDPALRRAGRFDKEIKMGIPDVKARISILRVLCKTLKLEKEFNFHYLATMTPGFVGADLTSLTREAAMSAVTRTFTDLELSELPSGDQQHCEDQSKESVPNDTEDNSNPYLRSLLNWLKDQTPLSEQQLAKLSITMNDFQTVLPTIQPSAKREGFAMIPDVTWDDIGALSDIRQELTLSILAPVRNPDQFEALGLTSPPGILLAGPPGCGKTLLAKAIANEAGINFISVKGPELLNMYVGESERAVRQCFQRAKNSVPCVIFFDELDALCPKRSDGEAGASVRVVNQLLTEMDGLEARRNVFVLAATNRPDIIDPAMLRPGRFDKILYVGLPQKHDQISILNALTKNGTKPLLSDDVSLSMLTDDKRALRFSGADLAALVREASVQALSELITTAAPSVSKTTQQQARTKPTPPRVTLQHFDAAFDKVKPSISEQDDRMYRQMAQRLASNVPRS